MGWAGEMGRRVYVHVASEGENGEPHSDERVRRVVGEPDHRVGAQVQRQGGPVVGERSQ